MTRLLTAAIILAALWLIWLYRDPDESPWVDDTDWLLEVDPYINTLGGHA